MTVFRASIVPAFILALYVTISTAAEPSTQPVSAPASTRPALDPAVERILDRLERRGESIKDIQAGIRYFKRDKVLESEQVYEGELLFRKEEPNPRFHIRFDKSNNDGELSNKKEWHVFDGQRYIEARESSKTIIPHQIVKPGEKTDVFKLGEGPFPLPFGQRKADIVRHFDVKLITPAPDDPPNTDHLECTPVPGTEMARKFGTVHFYIDRSNDLPVSVKTVEKEEGTEIGATFAKPQINTGFAGSRLNLPNLESQGYQTVEEKKQP